MSEEGQGGSSHPEMDREVQESEVPDTPAPGAEGAPASLTETYDNELRQNLSAHRWLRKAAFWSVGITSGVYLAGLFYTIIVFFHFGWFTAILETPDLDWRVLVLIGVVMTLFAAVPLTLIMGLVKMISERSDPEVGSGLKMPNSELAKLLFDVGTSRR